LLIRILVVTTTSTTGLGGAMSEQKFHKLHITHLIVHGVFDNGVPFARSSELKQELRAGDSLNINYKLEYPKENENDSDKPD
jgi:hypothetical protein